jgi:formate C-acetyltransferase
MCVQAPKFGRDDDNADWHAVRLLTLVLDEFDRIRKSRGFPPRLLLPCTQSNLHTIIGLCKEVGATPDGRKAGEPLSDNTSPSSGSCTRGPTAMFASLAKLPMDRLCSGALNVRLHPGHFPGEIGLANLAALIRTYFKCGGLQVQLSLADTAELRDAQEHPEAHRDLMVRITGYSAAFVDMAREAQDEIIRREEMHAGVPT